MLNQKDPKDYLLASGETHTIKEFVQKAFQYANIYGGWVEVEEEPTNAKFLLNSDGANPLVSINEEFFRPAEVEILLGDPSEIKKDLRWEPEISFDKLVERMVLFDIENEETKENE